MRWLPLPVCIRIHGDTGGERRVRTAEVGNASKASGVSGVGTGPDPLGCGAQLPSRSNRGRLRLIFDGTSLVRGTIGGAGTSAGMFSVTSTGGVTRTGSGAAAMASRSISYEVAKGRLTKARAATATWRYIVVGG